MRSLLWVLVPGLAGCATTVTPPERPADPVAVYIADYGRHATLLLPRGEGLAEYGYGHWRWFAHGEAWLAKGPLVLLIPGQATLARREVASEQDLTDDLGARTVQPLTVGRRGADLLLAQLDSRFESRRQELLHNPRHRLDFVPDPEPYWLGNNCNTVLADWLVQLGCRIDGPAMTSEFRFAPPAERDEDRLPAQGPPAAPVQPG